MSYVNNLQEHSSLGREGDKKPYQFLGTFPDACLELVLAGCVPTQSPNLLQEENFCGCQRVGSSFREALWVSWGLTQVGCWAAALFH